MLPEVGMRASQLCLMGSVNIVPCWSMTGIGDRPAASGSLKLPKANNLVVKERTGMNIKASYDIIYTVQHSRTWGVIRFLQETASYLDWQEYLSWAFDKGPFFLIISCPNPWMTEPSVEPEPDKLVWSLMRLRSQSRPRWIIILCHFTITAFWHYYISRFNSDSNRAECCN